MILVLLGFVSSGLSKNPRYRMGRAIGCLMRNLDKKRRDITLKNIRNSFPNSSQQWQKDIARESYANLGITLTELVAFKSFNEKNFHNYIEYENIEVITEAYKQGKGVILLSGHFGNWELLAYTAGLFTKIPVLIIVKPQSNTYADLHLNKIRTRDGNSVISMYNAATGIIRTLKQGGIVAMLADQSATQDKDIYVDFFGRPAATYEAPASLALRYGSPILMAFAERQPDHTYKTRLIEVESSDLQNNKDGIAELTKRHVKLLEDAIRKNPGSWAWQHRRWKHSPTTD